jgi:SNF2 family DNA or RNA helicase
LRDICGGCHTSDSSVQTAALPDLLAGSAKLAVLDALLRAVRLEDVDGASNKAKVVVVSNFKRVLAQVQRLAVLRGWETLGLDGATATRDRVHALQAFNRRGTPAFLFLLSSKAGGVGINLCAANRLVMMDPDWNPATGTCTLAHGLTPTSLKPTQNH